MATKDDISKLANLSATKQALLDRLRKRATLTVAPTIRRRPDRQGAPLSFAQQRLWLIQQLDLESYLYNVPRALSIRGPLEIPALRKALNSIIARHEVLRTTFPADAAGEPWQRIAPELTVGLSIIELSQAASAERDREIQRRVLEFGRKPFDLAQGPLLRAQLLQFNENDHVLALVMHHIISDGWTGGVLFRELGEFYQSHLRGDTHPLPDLSVQYADYANWQREWMQDAVLENELAFWRKNLAGAPPSLEMPTDRPRPDTLHYRGGSCSIVLGKDLSGQLKALCTAEATTLFPTMLAGLNIVLAQWSGQQDMVIGTISANRDQTEIENLIGCFMNFLPLRQTITPDESALEFLRTLKQNVFESFSHQNCPFEKIIEAVRPQRSLNINPLYNVMLLVQNYPEIAFRTETLEARLLRLEYGLAVLDLRFVVAEKAGEISIECEYSEELFDRNTIEHLLQGYVSVLEQMATNLSVRVFDFQIPHDLIEQSAAARKREQKKSIAITSTFTAEPVQPPLGFWMKQLEIRSEINFAPYNQVFQQLLDPASLISRNHDGFNVVLLRLTDWLRFEANVSVAAAKEKITDGVRDLARNLKSAAQRSSAYFFVCVCPLEHKFSGDQDWREFFGRMEQALAIELNTSPSIELITSEQILKFYPVENYEDEYADKLGHVPYTSEFFVALGTMLARRIFASGRVQKKAIALDCDRTLWVTGAEGIAGARVDAPRLALQEFVLKQAEVGMLICLCSKNSEQDIDGAFALNADMPLRPEHIVAQRLGVDSTSAALRELADELQLELDSFVCISSDSDVCSEVRARCPEVLTLLLPNDAAQIPSFLSNVWAFDQAGGSSGYPRITNQNQILNRIASDLCDVGSISHAIESAPTDHRPQRGVFVAPRNPVEEMIAGTWTEVLRLDRVGIHEDFFTLGGHSLLATQVVARVRRTLGVELPLRTMFESPTVAGLAKRVEAVRQSGVELQAPPITRSGGRDHLPLSFAQQRLWFLDQLEPGNPLYNMPQMFRMRGNLDVDSLQRSLQKIVERHDSLRTTFSLHDNEPVQVIAPKLPFSLPVTDLSEVPDHQQEAEAQSLAKQEAQRPFNLSRGPVLRAQLLRLAPEDHVLLLTMHHIVSDRWSMGVLAEELAAHYAAFAQHKAPPLPDLPIQYSDFAVWQRNWLQGEALDAQLQYWKQHLAGAPPVLELPADRPRPPQMSMRGAMQSLVLPRNLVEQLTLLSHSEGVTLFMTLLAAFQTLLSRYSGQEDVVIGSPIANRNFAEVEPLIGFFVNTLALRGDLSGDPSFRQLVARAKEVCLQAYAHQDIPFEKLVEELQPERSLSHSPIFQVMFALQNAPMQALELPGLKLERLPVYAGTSMFDMSWFAVEVPEGLMIRAEYSTDLFEDATITRGLAHFRNLLESAAANPGQRISQLEMLGQDERRKVLVEFNANQAEFPIGCLHDFIEQTAERMPDSTAVICGDERMSYGELNRRANQIAHYLMKLGAVPEVLVGVFLERTSDLLPAIVGVLKSGSAYVPLDPSYPRERLSAILEDAKAPIVLTQESLLPQVVGSSANCICVDADWKKIASESTENPRVEVKPENLAYVLFTSGSTGRPKGVALEHGSAVTFVQWAQTVFTREELAGVLLSTSVCFDLSIFEIFVPLSVSGKVIIVQNALYLPSAEAKDEVTLINTVPSAMAELVRMKTIPESVKVINLAGEALAETLVEEIYSATSVQKVYNLYGPTEDTTYSTYTLTRPNQPVTIGRPLPNTQAYVLDAHGNPQPVGVPGELYLAGDGLARGYYGRPDLTAERFLQNPFGTKIGARMYRTGDLCRWLPDGELEYLGRLDHQVKLRGFRIELGEVESVLAKHPLVRQCLVMAREDEPGLKRLVAYVVASEGAVLNEGELRDHLKQSLPEFMVPSAFVVLESFPLTPNGKINRKALPAPERKQTAEDDYIAPRTPFEEAVAAIWAKVLRLERVSVNRDFFALGGHSLLATQVISRVRQSLGADLPLRAMFESSTVAELAKRVEALQVAGGKTGLAIQPMPRTDTMPLSFAQQRVWFLNQLDPKNPLYNVPVAIGMTGRLHFEALLRSLNEIVNRHEVLRSTFAIKGDQTVQVIAPQLTINISVSDLTAIHSEDQHAAVKRLAIQGAKEVFDLGTGPLLRASLLRLGAEEHVLLLNMHHIVSDGWSMWQLIRELAALYTAYVQGKNSPLARLPIQYADYAVWQRKWLQGEVLDQHLNYWKKQLAGAPTTLELPTDRTRPAIQSYRGTTQSAKFSPELLKRLKDLSNSEGATLFMVLLAAYQTLLFRYTGQEDVVVGTPIANRNRAEIEELIGVFVNTLVMRNDLSGNPSFRELLRRVRSSSLEAYAYQDLPFEKLVEAVAPDRDLSRTPLFQVWFAFQNAPRSEFKLSGLELRSIEVHNDTSKFDLGLFVVEKPDGLHCMVEYSTDLFDGQTIERLLGHFEVLLEGVAADPNRAIADLPLLTAPERQQLLVSWNNTRVEYPRTRSLHQFIEAQVEKTPAASALIFESKHLTYEELNARANQLAHHLRKVGVGPDVLVGICAERSVEMVIGLLGIMKAGSAYVPLDPDHPRERLTAVIEDAAPPVLLTQEHLLGILPPHGGPVICLDRDWDRMRNEPVTNPESITSGKDQAYAIFTSGSTGKPKGVPNVHEGIVNRLLWMQHAYRLDGSDRVLQKTPYSFDVSVWEFFWPLMTGACLVVPLPEGHKDPNYLRDLIQQQNITTLHFVPSMLRIFLEADGIEGCTSLRRVICSGEALPLEVQGRFFQRLKAELHNLYGPTEASVDVTYWQCTPRYSRSIVPIGRPIWNTQIYILDQRLQPVPIGVHGELHIGGVGLARGYLNRPQLTAEKFIPDPFSSEPGARLYKTGDLCRFLPDGNIEYLGRIDHQVKIRGFRIELGEIESVLAKHAAVRQNLVIVREDEPGNKQLVAYVVPDKPYQGQDTPETASSLSEEQLSQPEKAFDQTYGQGSAEIVLPVAEQKATPTQLSGPVIRELVAQLRQLASQKLPEYMVPSAFVVLDGLPLSANGKIDRRALPPPDQLRHELEGNYVAPRTPEEEIVAGIWAEVLRLERIGVHYNFFDLGGHSLNATQVVSRVREAFKVEMPLRVLFESPTVEAFSRAIAALKQVGLNAEIPPLVRVPRNRKLPLSFAQQRLWFLDQLDPGNSLYNVPRAIRLTGNLDVQAMTRALNGLVARHEILRTTYQLVNDRPVQVISRQLTFELPVIDLSQLEERQREEDAQRIVQEESGKGFNLASDPILRGLLLKLEEYDHVLFLNTHHIASDGWSSGVLINDLTVLYAAALEDKTAALPELTIQYADYAFWQRNWLQGEVLEKQLAFWKARLDGAPPVLSLPTDRPRPAVQTFRGAVHEGNLTKNISDGLLTLGRQHGATMFMTMLSAFECLLAYYTGQQDIVIGTDLANRMNVQTEALIGFFVNLVVLRTDLSGDPTFAEVTGRVREVALGAYAHQDLPFDKLVEELRPERNLSHSPLVQVLFVQQNTPRSSAAMPGLEMERFKLEVQSKFDLAVFMRESGNEIAGSWVYNPDLFDAGTIARMTANYEMLVHAAIADPRLRLSELNELLAAAEKKQRGSEHKKFQEAGLEKLKKIRRKAIAEV